MIGQIKRTPISYWGGKQKLWQFIERCIPDHHTYIEPFVGGGAVFWLKSDAQKSVLNDLNNFVINFYWVVKNKFFELDSLIQSSLHSRNLHEQAKKMYKHPQHFSRVELAWSFWYLTNFSLMQGLDSASMQSARREDRVGLRVHHRKEQFDILLSQKLKYTTLENRDALWIIDFYDWEQAFFFVDPPYIGTNCGHYHGYTSEDFTQLLAKLHTIKGKFLLTCYPNDVLVHAVQQYHYHHHIIRLQKDSATFNSGSKVMKEEMFVANFPFDPFTHQEPIREFIFA
ncbi:DNA adenine methylase (plasmid) [Entomospira entomophila]|uniref:DNA adenine methylase n=1 Tax=Entomospira entomophila TaxID=2719988 RepID=A0A968GAK6_9SPIO|nr:DNA adenine methylase [Entomospira entomophilus]NIZ41547.1 DNA adenine methylase [Entomospira entomophilus]WDI36425.1 DNA adenine methylase [Entomospira entomophilus]